MDKNTETKRINLCNKIYPVYYGFSSDLIFYIAINTLFLTTVKGLSFSKVNLITAIGALSTLLFYVFSHKIIKKIGNLTSIKIGTIFMLIAALLFTFSNNLILFIIAQVFYESSAVFKCMESVVISNNLSYQNKSNDYIKIRTSATTIYAFTTMVASLIGGFLFNYNPYLPMYICIITCIISYILSNFLYEVKYKDNNNNSESKIQKFAFNKITITTIIIYGLLFGAIVVLQNNDKLFIQNKLDGYLNPSNVAIVMSVILFLSRVSRFISNIFFGKIYNKLKNKTLYLMYSLLLFTVFLFIGSDLFLSARIGSIIMASGFILLLALRDPVDNLLNNIILQNTNKDDKEKAMLCFQFARRLMTFTYGIIASMILVKKELLNVYIVLLILLLIYILIINKLFALINKKNRDIND